MYGAPAAQGKAVGNEPQTLKSAGYVNVVPKPNDGISTAVEQLLDAAQRNTLLSERIESNLGISYPRESGNGTGPASLREVILETARRIRESNDTLERIDSHLIS